MIIVDLYWIATNKALNLDVRYAAAQQMQTFRKPEKKIKEIRPYTKGEIKMITGVRGRVKDLASALERTPCAIKNKRTQLRKQGRT